MAGKIKSGLRYKGGKRKQPTTRKGRQAWDYGNEVVQRRRAMFDCMAIKGGKAADQVHDGIGQLWALDYLDGHGHESDTLRDAGRLFAVRVALHSSSAFGFSSSRPSPCT